MKEKHYNNGRVYGSRTYEYCADGHGFRIKSSCGKWVIEEYTIREFSQSKFSAEEALLAATNTRLEQTSSGYYQVLQADELIYDDPASEDMYDYELAKAMAANIIVGDDFYAF